MSRVIAIEWGVSVIGQELPGLADDIATWPQDYRRNGNAAIAMGLDRVRKRASEFRIVGPLQSEIRPRTAADGYGGVTFYLRQDVEIDDAAPER